MVIIEGILADELFNIATWLEKDCLHLFPNFHKTDEHKCSQCDEGDRNISEMFVYLELMRRERVTRLPSVKLPTGRKRRYSLNSGVTIQLPGDAWTDVPGTHAHMNLVCKREGCIGQTFELGRDILQTQHIFRDAFLDRGSGHELILAQVCWIDRIISSFNGTMTYMPYS